MSPAATTKIQTPLTAIEQLQLHHGRRAGLTGELAVLNASSAKLRAAANAEAAVLREIGEMGSAEIAAMTAWASAGCLGDPPAPDLKQRRALAEKLAGAQAGAAAAVGAGQDVDFKRNQELATVNQLIEQAALDIMQDEMMMVRAQYAATIEVVRTLAAKQLSLTSYLSGEGRRLIDRGDDVAGKRYLARAEALSRLTMADPGVSRDEIIAALNDWSIRAAALRKGSPS